MKSIYYDFTKLDEFFNCAPTKPIEILSEEEMVKQGMIKPIEGEEFSGPAHPKWKGGLRTNNQQEYMRKWYQENKEKINERHKQYYQKNKEKILENQKQNRKQYRLENKEKIKERKRRWYQENRERILEHKKQYNLENKEKRKEYQKQYRLAKKNT
mgnify:CR=1 FL=1|jgi:hypothetical protein